MQSSSALAFRYVRVRAAGISNCQAFWLTLYFLLNLTLTLYNKVLLLSFPYPYTLTAIHALFGLAGGTFLRLQNVYQPKSLHSSDHAVLVVFSVLYSVNIAISNASLDLVTVPVSCFAPRKMGWLTFGSSTKLFVLQRQLLLQSFLGIFLTPASTAIKFPR
jgi:hypothetical protein